LNGRPGNQSFKIDYSRPNIPIARVRATDGGDCPGASRKKKLSVAQMRQITGTSRNTLARGIKVLKLLGWIEFHGSRKNGFFTLTASFPGF
jgi:hypothetical protein